MTTDQQQRRPFVLHTRVVTGNGGGPEKTLLNSPRFLNDFGVDSACMFLHPPGDEGIDALRRRGEVSGAEVIGIEDSGPLDMSVVRECIRLCRERNVDIWHGHDYKSNALGLLVRMFHPMKLVTTAHGWVKFTSKTPLYYAIDRFCMKWYHEVVCVSQDLCDRCRDSGISEDRLSLIDNAIVAPDYDPSPAKDFERREFGFDSSWTVLGAVGRLSEEKGFHHLINAVHHLQKDGHRVGLLIAGEGDQRETLEKQIGELGLQDSVRLVGFLQDPRQLYRAIDIFVLSSLREGLPNVVLEAMASGRPVVTTRVNGIPRLVQDQENGIVVETDSMECLLNGIRPLVESQADRDRLALAGRETVEGDFSFEKRMAKMCGVYRSLGGTFTTRIRATATPRFETLEPVSV